MTTKEQVIQMCKDLRLPSIRKLVMVHFSLAKYTSMLYQAGIDMKEAQEIIGQASIEITNNIYTHVSQKQKIATADKLANFASF